MNQEIKTKIEKTFHRLLQHLECTSCHDFDWMAMAPDYHETSSSSSSSTPSLQHGWNLYIKEFETYRAFVLWHSTLEKDWSQVFPNKNSISLFDEHQNHILTLESVGIQNEFTNWVPSEKDQHMYERILDQPKPFHNNIQALFVGTYSIQM